MSPPEPSSTRTAGARIGDLLVVVGGALVVGFSFAPFVRYGGEIGGGLAVDGVTGVFNAWSLTTFMVPLTTFVVVAALLAIAATATRFWLGRDPILVGFRLRQLEVGLTLFMFVVLLGMISSAKHVFFGANRFQDADAFALSPLDVAGGAVMMLLGAIVALVGAVLNHFGIGPVLPVGGRNQATGQPGPGAGAGAGGERAARTGYGPTPETTSAPPPETEWTRPDAAESGQPPASESNPWQRPQT